VVEGHVLGNTALSWENPITNAALKVLMASPQMQPASDSRESRSTPLVTDLRRALSRTIWLRLRLKLMKLVESSSAFRAD
jgi:hypothetical protein